VHEVICVERNQTSSGFQHDHDDGDDDDDGFIGNLDDIRSILVTWLKPSEEWLVNAALLDLSGGATVQSENAVPE
jgi:hypothetical protein